MDVIIALRSGSDSVTVEPAACSVTMAVCNESLQHVENACDAKLVYDPDLLAFLVSHESMDAVVAARGGNVLFTGIAGADASWADQGEPFPVDGLSLSIKDYTAKLDVQNGSEIALLNAPLSAVLRRLTGDCGLAAAGGNVPGITLEAFVMPPGRNYRQTLDALCYQYSLCFYFDSLGAVNFFSFADIPDNPPPLGQNDILAGMRIKKSRRRYDRVEVEYTTLARRNNEQVFFESFGYDSNGAPSPAIIQPGVYYPFDSSPVIEEAEGQVYQSFASGFAESRKKFNGELEFRRSAGTSLLYSENHRVAEDWEGPLEISRTGFESLRASVRFKNTGNADAKLRQFAIRADALYRNKSAVVAASSGSGGLKSGDKSFNTMAEFIYRAEHAESLAVTLSRFFSRSGLNLELSTDRLRVEPGTYYAVDTGKSGLAVNALILSRTLDCDRETYSCRAVSVGPAAVDVSRFKNAEPDPPRGPKGTEGDSAVRHDLLPSVTVIRMDANGNLQPGAVSCEQRVAVGSDPPATSYYTIKYKSSTDTGETLYTGPVTVRPDWKWIDFFLYNGTILLGRERVPVLASGREGNDAITLDLLRDHKLISCDIDGVPLEGMLPFTNKATLFRGQREINRFTEFRDDIQRRMYFFPGRANIMQPLSAGMYPVSVQFVRWSVPDAPAGVAIDQDGNITAALGAGLHDRDDLIVRAEYNGGIFEIIFTVTKLRLAADGVPGAPGADGVTYYTWIKYADDARGNGISNNPDGKHYIGFAYNKVSPVESNNPGDYAWSLIRGEDGVDGVNGYTWIKYSDNPDGSGMYQQPRGTTRYIGIAVNKDTPDESDNPGDYTWSLFRGSDGSSPVTVRLLDSNVSVMCDMFGNPLTLPFSTRACLYKGNALVTDESRYPELFRRQTVRFPGSGLSAFSPAFGSFYPVVRTAVIWSAQGPRGVSIDAGGIIAVANGAELGDTTQILVTGTFEGGRYTTALNITKAYAGKDGEPGEPGKPGENAPSYLGLADSISVYNNAIIINGRQVTARIGDWVMHKAQALVYRWAVSGGQAQWVSVPRPTETERQNASMYLLATTELTDGEPMGIFSDVQARSLIAKTVFAKLLAAGEIELNDEYGLGGIIRSANYRASGGALGWMIDFLGDAVFNNLKLRGNLDANVSLLGGWEYQLLGGVREFASFYYSTSVTSLAKSIGIKDVYRLSIGIYRLTFFWEDTDVALKLNIIGGAYTSNNAGLLVLKRNSGTQGGAGEYNSFIDFEIRNPGGSLADPYFVTLHIIA